MRHVISIALIVGAILAAAAAWGPLYFGAPVFGVSLLLAAVSLELLFWLNADKKRFG